METAIEKSSELSFEGKGIPINFYNQAVLRQLSYLWERTKYYLSTSFLRLKFELCMDEGDHLENGIKSNLIWRLFIQYNLPRHCQYSASFVPFSLMSILEAEWSCKAHSKVLNKTLEFVVVFWKKKLHCISDIMNAGLVLEPPTRILGFGLTVNCAGGAFHWNPE